MYTVKRLSWHWRIHNNAATLWKESCQWSARRELCTWDTAVGIFRYIDAVEYWIYWVHVIWVTTIHSTERVSSALGCERRFIWACKKGPITWWCSIRKVHATWITICLPCRNVDIAIWTSYPMVSGSVVCACICFRPGIIAHICSMNWQWIFRGKQEVILLALLMFWWRSLDFKCAMLFIGWGFYWSSSSGKNSRRTGIRPEQD